MLQTLQGSEWGGQAAYLAFMALDVVSQTERGGWG